MPSFFARFIRLYNEFMAKRLYIQLYNAKTGESITLPLNPETTDIPNEKDIRTYNILGYGEVSVKGNRQLKRLSLSNVLPDDNTRFASLASLVKEMKYKSYSMRETIDMLNRWTDNDEIIRVIISGHLNAEFRIASHTSQIRESVSDVGYSIELIEYRDPTKKPEVYSTEIMKFATPEEQKTKVQKLKERIINRYIPAQITGQQGQTIYKIAKLYYGGKWEELRKKNSNIEANLNLAGQIVEMLPL